MVQLTRLKHKTHPLFPVITLILLVLAFLFLALPALTQRVANEYQGYLSKRIVQVNKYNELLTSLNGILTFKYDTKDQYYDGLKKASTIISQIKSVLTETANLDIQILTKKLTGSEISEIEKYMSEDSVRLSTITQIQEQVDLKMKAIEVSESIQNLTYCLKKVKTRSDLQECEYISEGVGTPAKISPEYRKLLNSIFLNYFEQSSTTRVKNLNKVIVYHNNMNKGLEVIINKSIDY